MSRIQLYHDLHLSRPRYRTVQDTQTFPLSNHHVHVEDAGLSLVLDQHLPGHLLLNLTEGIHMLHYFQI